VGSWARELRKNICRGSLCVDVSSLTQIRVGVHLSLGCALLLMWAGLVFSGVSAAAQPRVVRCEGMRLRTSWTFRVHSGRDRGSVVCRPVGVAAYRGRLRVVHHEPNGAWYYVSRFTMSFARGSLWGVLDVGRLNVFPYGGKVQQYAGSVRVLRGTGAYSHVTGLGPIVCGTRDGGTLVRCNFSLKLAGV
jgi:hypothetical protein